MLFTATSCSSREKSIPISSSNGNHQDSTFTRSKTDKCEASVIDLQFDEPGANQLWAARIVADGVSRSRRAHHITVRAHSRVTAYTFAGYTRQRGSVADVAAAANRAGSREDMLCSTPTSDRPRRRSVGSS